MKKINYEYGLFIIWSNARKEEKRIINDINKRFEIMNIFEIEWDKDIFSKNLTRFYGVNLPKNSDKESHCGNDKFLLIIVKDNSPIYSYRKTSKGKKYLNVNLFDSKTMYRSWTGRHMVHGTNDKEEFSHDLMLLLGKNLDDYLKEYEHNDKIQYIKNNIVGERCWSSLEQVFYVLNSTIPYVVLRNFDKLPEIYEIGIHSDIDILCDNRDNISKILNALPEKKSKKRSRYMVKINDNIVYMDFRYIGDNYYDEKWEKEILKSRVKNKCFYIPSHDNYCYSLLYHVLVQKNFIAEDYMDSFKKLFKTDDINILKEKLAKFIKENNYEYLDPIDFSVYFNKNIAGKRMRLFKIIRFKYRSLKSKIFRRI